MTAPVPKVEVGFGSTWLTADASISWTDVTSDVRLADQVSTTRGRRSVQDRFATGSLGLVFNNQTRKYDTLHAAGTYFGQLKPGVPIRVTTTPSGQSSRAVARGFISGFPQRYEPGNTLSTVPISGFGIFDKLARAKLPQSAVDVEVLADTPVAYWKLDDTTEAEMLDSSGNDNHGIYDNPDLGQDALVADGGKAVSFDHVGDHRGKINEVLITAYPFTLEAWVKFPRNLTQVHTFAGALSDTAARQFIWFLCTANDATFGPNPNGCLTVWLEDETDASAPRRLRGSTTIDDDVTHHCVGVINSATSVALYVDSATESLTTIDAGSGATNPGVHRLWTVGNLWDTKFGDWGIAGLIDNVAVYASALSAARVLAHYNSGVAPWDGDTTNERLDRILDVVGLPADRRSFQACTTVLGSTVLGQQRALDYMRLVEASEDGRMFETADGKIRFLDRYWGYTDSHGSTSQVTFSDLTGISYSDLQIDPDDELVVNICSVTREGGVAIPPVTNQTSYDLYGPADTSIDTLLQTDAEARSLAEHVVLVRGTPRERVSKLSVPLHRYTGAQQASILDLDIGHRITVARTPQGVGSAMSLALVIEGIDHRINTFEHWVDFNVSVASTSDVAIWGTSLWGTGPWGW